MEINSKRNFYFKAFLISIAVTLFGLLLWKFDFEILFFIQNHLRNDFFDFLMPFYSNLGNDGIIWIVLGIVLLIPKKTRKCGILVLSAFLVKLLVSNVIMKNLFERPRPCATYPEMVDLIKIPSSYSFPSGHTVAAIAVTFTIFLQNKKIGIFALIMGLLMGFTRLYLFVHFPTDVYGGIIIGVLIAIGVYYADKKFSPIINKKIAEKRAK